MMINIMLMNVLLREGLPTAAMGPCAFAVVPLVQDRRVIGPDARGSRAVPNPRYGLSQGGLKFKLQKGQWIKSDMDAERLRTEMQVTEKKRRC